MLSHADAIYSLNKHEFARRGSMGSGSLGEPRLFHLAQLSVPYGMTSDEFSLGRVETSLTPQERFEEFLQSRGKRNTEQRKTLVDHVFGRHEHFDADELIAEIARQDRSRRVSRPTIYRTLAELVEAGLLRKMDLGGRAVYEHDYGYPQHDHLHCTRCNKLIEFQSDKLREIRDAVAREHQFRVTGHRLIISGICQACSRTRRRQRRPVDMV